MIFDSEIYTHFPIRTPFWWITIFWLRKGLERASYSCLPIRKLSPKVSNYYSNWSLVGKWRWFCSRIFISVLLTRNSLIWSQNLNDSNWNMGKKKAKEPETPAKDEVGIFGQRSAQNSPMEFPKQSWLLKFRPTVASI